MSEGEWKFIGATLAIIAAGFTVRHVLIWFGVDFSHKDESSWGDGDGVGDGGDGGGGD